MAREFFRIRFPGFPWDFAYGDVESRARQVPCKNCGYGLYKWDTPLIIKLDKESPDVIGDFTPLMGGSYMVVTDRVCRTLNGKFGGLGFYSATILPRGRKQKRSVVSEASLWWWLEPTIVVPMNQEDYQWEIVVQPRRCSHFVLKPPSGFEIREKDLNGVDTFRVQLEPRSVYITRELKDFIMRNQFTNISTEYAGVITEPGEEGKYFRRNKK